MALESPQRSLHALPPGAVLHDYVIESELGSGGFSIVYLARHRLNSDWLFAIKEFLPRELAVRDNDGASVHPVDTEASDAFEDGLKRFRDEAEQLRKFRNEPYIVSCLNYFEQNGTAYLVMDYDDGLPLSEFLERREAAGQPFAESDLRAVVEPLLEGLEVIHRAGVLHRDIKPGNVFVRRSDDITGRPAQPVLIDFGAAKQNYLAQHSRSHAPYTPGFASYEQVSSEGKIGPTTDIYAVGALMWRMVAGGCPEDERLFVTEGAGGTGNTGVWTPTPRAVEKRAYALHRGRSDPMVPAVQLGAGRFSPALLRAIDACLKLYPEDRVQNCQSLARLLEGTDGSEFRSEPHGKSASASGNTNKPFTVQRDPDDRSHRNTVAAIWTKASDMLRRRTGSPERYVQREIILAGGGQVTQDIDISDAEAPDAQSWRMPATKTWLIAATVVTAISLASTVYVRVPLAPDREPVWNSNNVLGAAAREHGVLLNLTVLASEQLAFDEDPQFNKLLAYYLWMSTFWTAQSGELLSEEEWTDLLQERASADAQLARARSRAEFEYLKRKASQTNADILVLRRSDILGTLSKITVIFLDPFAFLAAWALLSIAFRRRILAPHFGGFRSAMIGALICGCILAAQQSILLGVDYTRTERTINESIGMIVVGTALCSLVFGVFGAISRRRTRLEFAARQDESIRVGLVAGLAAPILQLVLEQLGAANDFGGAEMLIVAFLSFVIVAVFHSLLGSIAFFAKRKDWIVWLFVPGVLLAHSIVGHEVPFFDSILNSYYYGYDFAIYLFNVMVLTLFWAPSALIFTLTLGFFDKRNIGVDSGTVLPLALLAMVGTLTWIALGDIFGVTVTGCVGRFC